MNLVVEAGCDGATLCAFDPAALPADFDRLVCDDPVAVTTRLQSEGRFWIGETGADGRFVFEVYVDEPVQTMAAGTRFKLEAQFPEFACPSGTI